MSEMLDLNEFGTGIKAIGLGAEGKTVVDNYIKNINKDSISSNEDLSGNSLDLIRNMTNEEELIFLVFNCDDKLAVKKANELGKLGKINKILTVGVILEDNVDIDEDKEKVHKELEENIDVVIKLDRKKLENSNIDKHKFIGEIVDILVESLLNPSMINIDLGDVEDLLKDKGTTQVSIVNSTPSEGISELVSRLINNNMCELNEGLPKNVIVYIEIGKEYSNKLNKKELEVVNEILTELYLVCNEEVNLIFALNMNESIQDNIKIGMIYTI